MTTTVGRWNYSLRWIQSSGSKDRQNCSQWKPMQLTFRLIKRPIIMNLRGRNKVSAEFNMSSDRYCFLITHILYADINHGDYCLRLGAAKSKRKNRQ
jgi:hypothetical protein